jgi:hypothetical protein
MKIKSVFTWKRLGALLAAVAAGVGIYLFVWQIIYDKLDRSAVLAEVQDARDRLDGVLLGRQLNWRITNSTELQFAGRITNLFADDESLVKELQKLYRSLSAGISNAKELRQVLSSKEANPTDAVNLENAIRRVVEEADLVGPRLAAKVGGTWRVSQKNIPPLERATDFLYKSKEASGSVVSTKPR